MKIIKTLLLSILLLQVCLAEAGTIELNLGDYGVPVSIEVPEGTVVKEESWGDLSLIGGKKFRIDISVGVTTNMIVAKKEVESNDLNKLVKFHALETNGWLYESSLYEGNVQFHFDYLIEYKGKKFLFRDYRGTDYTKEEAEVMYNAVRNCKVVGGTEIVQAIFSYDKSNKTPIDTLRCAEFENLYVHVKLTKGLKNAGYKYFRLQFFIRKDTVSEAYNGVWTDIENYYLDAESMAKYEANGGYITIPIFENGKAKYTLLGKSTIPSYGNSDGEQQMYIFVRLQADDGYYFVYPGYSKPVPVRWHPKNLESYKKKNPNYVDRGCN